MANSNFIVQNGLTVGPLTIDAATGSITTSGNVNITGNLGVSQISKNDSSIGINDTGSGSNVSIIVDGTQEAYFTTSGFTVLNTIVADTLNAKTVGNTGATVTAATVNAATIGNAGSALTGTLQTAAQTNVTSVGTLTGLTLSGTLTGTTINAATIGNVGAAHVGASVQAATIGNAGALLTGTLQTAAQTNITSVGTLSSLATSGDITVGGNLLVNGTTVTINATTITTNDKNIVIANNQTTGSGIDGSGIDAGGGTPIATFRYNNATTSWQSNVAMTPAANASVNMGGTANYWNNLYAANHVGTTGNFGASVTASTFISNAANGTAPMTISSTTLVTNLNADLWDGNHFSSYLDQAVKQASTPTFAGVTTSGAIVPNANATVNLGSTSAWFNNVYGVTFVGVSTTAKYADLAENYSADAEYEPGTVLMFGGDAEVTLCDLANNRRVAGVVTTAPAYLMNSDLEGTKAAIALQGRVPCKVIGPVRKGDMMVSAGAGRAKSEENPEVGAVIGKALENFDGAEGVIEVVIGRV